MNKRNNNVSQQEFCSKEEEEEEKDKFADKIGMLWVRLYMISWKQIFDDFFSTSRSNDKSKRKFANTWGVFLFSCTNMISERRRGRFWRWEENRQPYAMEND